jgi:hypothetical protein
MSSVGNNGKLLMGPYPLSIAYGLIGSFFYLPAVTWKTN